MYIIYSLLFLFSSWQTELIQSEFKIAPKRFLNGSCNRSDDSLVLVKFYLSTGGPNWTVRWNLNLPMTQWAGVGLSAMGCVQSLNLPNNELNGTLPFEIGNLTGLKVLYLFGNKLFGLLPSSLGSLSSIEDLALEDNNFDGQIPFEIGNASSLKFLSLSKNNLSGNLPSSISNLGNLILLNISYNQLDGSIPSSISQLSKMTILDLSHNNLNGVVPTSIGQLSNIKEIYLNHNNLSGVLPASMSNLIALNIVWLNDNYFVGLVPDMRSAPLNALRIENNSLDQIPDYSTVTTWGNQLPFGFVIYGNKFTFDDLIPLSKIHRRYYYSFKPQDPIPLDSIIYINAGSNYIIITGVDPGLSDNNFKWFKDTNVVYISNRNTYEILNVTEADEGYYSARITNPLISDFELEIAKFRVVVYNPNNCDKPISSSSCSTAPEFCSTSELHSYCGTLTVPDTSGQVFLCDSFEKTRNARWLSFRAPADSIVFEIFPLSCEGVDEGGVLYKGMQAAIWNSCGGNIDSVVVCQTQCQEQQFTIGGNYFKVGEKYKLLLNGCKGDICNFLIKVIAGKQNFELVEPGSISGDQSFCPDSLDHYFSIASIPGASIYQWFINDTFYQSTPDSFISIKNFKTGIYQLKVRALNFCDSTNSSFLIFQITPSILIKDIVVSKIQVDSAFQLTFIVEGGIPPYKVQKGRGKIDSLSSKFFSDTLLCRSAYDFEIIDARGCSVVYKGLENCGCNSKAGSMPIDTIKVCEGQSFTTKFIGSELQDPADIGVYILFTDPGNPKSSIIKTSSNGLFPFDPSKFRFDVYYYVSRIVGRTNAKGEINYEHPCVSYSNFQAVIFRSRPLVSVGPDLIYCGLEGILNSFGNYTSGLWKKLNGPGNASFENPIGDLTKVNVDTFGTYGFVREVSNGYCSHKDEIKVTFIETLKPIVNGFLFVCPGQTTELDGGPYSKFKWSTGDSTKIINVASAGTYCLTVTDAGNCTGSTCIAVGNATAPIPVLQAPDTICTGDLKFIQVTQSFLKYHWNTLDSNSILPIDTGGLYCLTVTANNGCIGTDCVFVTPKSRSFSFRSDTICFGDSFTLFGQTLGAPGIYDVSIDNASQNACDSVIRVNLAWYPQIKMSDTTIIKDDGTGSGAISVVIHGGKGPYQYQWSTGGRTSIITNLKAGNYTLIITDANNCKASFIITVPNLTSTEGVEKLKFEFIVYPNPIHSKFNCLIQNKSDERDLQIYVYNSNGVLVNHNTWKSNGYNDVFPICLDLASGIYHFKILNNKGVSTFLRIHYIH
ncbi:MAG: T9SS type A sorting domain-containing protein [Saprospiraceae bacterium]